MIDKLKAWYGSLPSWAQGLIVTVEAGVVGFLVQWFSDPSPLCFSRDCLRHFAGAIGAVIVMSVRNWLKASPLEQKLTRQ